MKDQETENTVTTELKFDGAGIGRRDTIVGTPHEIMDTINRGRKANHSYVMLQNMEGHHVLFPVFAGVMITVIPEEKG